MRLLIIEKKTAAKFGFDDGDTVEHRQHSNNTHEEGEGDPLFKPPQDQAYVIPPELPRVIKSNPILYCCKDVRMLTANWITLIQATLMGTFDATVPTIGEEYYAFNSLETGLLFIPVLLPGLILGPLAGGITDRRGPRTIVGWGYGLLAPMFILLQFVQPGGLNQVLIYCLLLFLCGTCLAVTNPPALVQATLVIEKYHKANPEIFGPHGPYAGVSSITGTMYNAGTALGSLLAGALKDAIGYGNMNLVMATLSLLTAVLGFLFIGERPEDTVDCSVD
ncbi:MAG: hypothetical protein LQ342_003477 [Letrouitia transgressa]|nr:MAG: hypothetical protein LQ342_003477 [Letrouitia transgressa]